MSVLQDRSKIIRDVPDVKFAGFRIPDVAGCCLPDSGAGFRIPDPDFGKIKRLRGPIFSINNFSTILHI